MSSWDPPLSFLKSTLEREKPQAGLYLVSTPIGNRADITLRALHILGNVDLILCEDTRLTKPFLSFYHIQTPLSSYHDHSPERVREKILTLLQHNQSIALVSDAGTPLISDPGYKLVQACYQHHIHVTALPGPCAPIMALTLSGLPPDQFQFGGFIPSKSSARRTFYDHHRSVRMPLIFFETALRLLPSLHDLHACLGNRHIAVARELTKKFEDVRRGSVETLIAMYEKEGPPKGELILIIEGDSKDPRASEESICQILEDLKNQKVSLREAVDRTFSQVKGSRREIYRLALKIFS